MSQYEFSIHQNTDYSTGLGHIDILTYTVVIRVFAIRVLKADRNICLFMALIFQIKQPLKASNIFGVSLTKLNFLG